MHKKEELQETLKMYKGILTNPIADYLNSLLELEFSVVKDYIDDTNRKALTNLDIYKRIAQYNIYMRALNILRESGLSYKKKDENNILSIFASLEFKDIELFAFDYSNGLDNLSIVQEGVVTKRIGDIFLYQVVKDEEFKEKELEKAMYKLESLCNAKNPYRLNPYTCGGPASYWEIKREREIRKYETLRKELEHQKELNDDEKKEIEITNKVYEMLLEDYGLTNNFKNEEISEDKKLVKRMPNLNIITKVKRI